MVSSSETWSEEARVSVGAGANILDLDRYMRGSRPARRAPPKPRDLSSSELVVDAGAGAGGGRSSSSELSHDSGLSDTTYRHQRAVRRKRDISSIDSRSGTETAERRRGNKSGGEAKERRRSKTSVGEATERRGKKSGEATRWGSSDSSRKFCESLERALRDQQAQIARVAALCERQAQAQARSERSERHKERSHKPGDRRSGKPTPRPGSGAGATRRSSSGTTLSSSPTNSRLGSHMSSEWRTYKIIMSKLDQVIAAWRSVPAAPAPAPTRARPRTRGVSSGSVTISDKVVGTDSQQHTTRQAKARRTSVVAAGAVDIPPRQNVITESVVRGEEREPSAPASDKAMPGRFHLDDPVRLYQQAKRLEAARAERRSLASGSSRGSTGSARGSTGSARGSTGSARGSTGSHGSARGSPSLCALCRCYWTVARRYVAAQLTAVRE